MTTSGLLKPRRPQRARSRSACPRPGRNQNRSPGPSGAMPKTTRLPPFRPTNNSSGDRNLPSSSCSSRRPTRDSSSRTPAGLRSPQPAWNRFTFSPTATTTSFLDSSARCSPRKRTRAAASSFRKWGATGSSTCKSRRRAMASSNSACKTAPPSPPSAPSLSAPPAGWKGGWCATIKAAIKSAHVYVYQEDFLGEHTSGIASPDVAPMGVSRSGVCRRTDQTHHSGRPVACHPPQDSGEAGNLRGKDDRRGSALRADRPRRGRVETEGDGAPVAGATVYVYYGSFRQGETVLTDADGRFAVMCLPARSPATHHKSGQVCRLDRRGGRLGYRDQGSRRGGDLRSAAAGLGRNRGACRSSCRSLESSRGGGGRSRRYRQPPLRLRQERRERGLHVAAAHIVQDRGVRGPGARGNRRAR